MIVERHHHHNPCHQNHHRNNESLSLESSLSSLLPRLALALSASAPLSMSPLSSPVTSLLGGRGIISFCRSLDMSAMSDSKYSSQTHRCMHFSYMRTLACKHKTLLTYQVVIPCPHMHPQSSMNVSLCTKLQTYTRKDRHAQTDGQRHRHTDRRSPTDSPTD